MSIWTLYHGSSVIIEKPCFGVGHRYNDYGLGFYCTEHIELAKEWACTDKSSGFANAYILNVDGLKLLDLTSSEFGILNWMAILVDNRRVSSSTPLINRGKAWLKDNYLIDISKYDVISGYRADDAYFSFARAFLGNEITVEQLSLAMRLGSLGIQRVLKSEKAFERIEFTGFESAERSEYYPRRTARDRAARKEFQEILEKEDAGGFYLSDLMRKEIKQYVK
ncbi:MAG: DUF3990 domain-containing protein [Firmicutes bacterium]|nr:DUF3990 domain-containing protein [Bacillota bacterium]